MRVIGLRAVAGLTVDMRMLPFVLDVGHIGVAGFTRLMTGELHRARCNFTNGSRSIVAILPKARWNYEMADHQEHNECENEQSRKSEQMTCILE